MSSHSNSSQAHDFYYLGVNEGLSKDYTNCTVSYSGNTAYSYSTAVAKVIPRKGVKPGEVRTHSPSTGITLISFDSMSATTAQHISKLSSASPFKIVRVPMRRGNRDFTPETLAKLFAEELALYADGLNRAENRAKFAELMAALRFLRENACKKWAKPLRSRKLFKKFDSMDVDKLAAELKERNRKAAAKAAKETREIFAKYVKDRHGADYLEFIRALCDRHYDSPKYRFTDEQRAILHKKALGCPGNWDRKSYVWLDGDKVVTSQNIEIPVREAKVAMRAWALGKDMRTFQIGGYQVVSYHGDTIQIGCHKIPRENMLALYEAVMGKPFPEKPESPAAQEGA